MDVYELKLRIEHLPRLGSRTKEFAAALSIYSRLTPLHDRTEINEIIYWGERYNTTFTDELAHFLIYVGQELVGFAQCVHFKKRNVVVIDYITIEDKRHDIGLYVLSLEMITRHFTSKANIDFFVTELTKPLGQEKLSADEFHWQETLKLTGFKTAQAPYQQPKLGLENYESDRPGYLIILPTNPADAISKDTYISIVRLIYFDHYFRWYEPFLDQAKSTYSDALQKTLLAIEQKIRDRETVKLNGTKGASTGRHEVDQSDNDQLKPRHAAIAYLLFFLILFSIFIVVPLISTISFSNVATAAAIVVENLRYPSPSRCFPYKPFCKQLFP